MRQLATILALLFCTTKLFSQTITVEQIENDLHNTYSKLLSYRFDGNMVGDSLEIENITFRNKMGKYTSLYPLTLTYQFDSLRHENIFIVSSEDKLFRIYSWDTWLGGTMSYFENVFQYKIENKVYSKVHFDSTEYGEGYAPFYSQIFTLNANQKTYYLAVNNGIYSTKDVSQSIKIFTIENHSLNDTVKLIKAKSGLVNSIDIYFDFFSVVDRPERPLRLITYDNENKIIYIPRVYENGKVSDSFILFKFTGEYFEQIESQKANENE